MILKKYQNKIGSMYTVTKQYKINAKLLEQIEKKFNE